MLKISFFYFIFYSGFLFANIEQADCRKQNLKPEMLKGLIGPCGNFSQQRFFGNNIGLIFKGQDLRYTQFILARIDQGIFDFSRLFAADLRELTCFKCSFIRANLTDAKFNGYIGKNSNFSNSVCIRSDFSGAKLEGSKFVGADLSDARLRLANLSFVDFTETNLKGTDLSHAVIIGTKFIRTKINSKTVLPFNLPKDKNQLSAQGFVYED
jgi:uncharacterized protein YjbI with pentapeptide repeats